MGPDPLQVVGSGAESLRGVGHGSHADVAADAKKATDTRATCGVPGAAGVVVVDVQPPRALGLMDLADGAPPALGFVEGVVLLSRESVSRCTPVQATRGPRNDVLGA